VVGDLAADEFAGDGIVELGADEHRRLGFERSPDLAEPGPRTFAGLAVDEFE
jgi:hypothetical protein